MGQPRSWEPRPRLGSSPPRGAPSGTGPGIPCPHWSGGPSALLWPECPCLQVEAEAVYRAITIAKQANCPLYVTKVMSKGAADVVAHAKRRGECWASTPMLGRVGGGSGSHSWPPRSSAGSTEAQRGTGPPEKHPFSMPDLPILGIQGCGCVACGSLCVAEGSPFLLEQQLLTRGLKQKVGRLGPVFTDVNDQSAVYVCGGGGGLHTFRSWAALCSQSTHIAGEGSGSVRRTQVPADRLWPGGGAVSLLGLAPACDPAECPAGLIPSRGV